MEDNGFLENPWTLFVPLVKYDFELFKEEPYFYAFGFRTCDCDKGRARGSPQLAFGVFSKRRYKAGFIYQSVGFQVSQSPNPKIYALSNEHSIGHRKCQLNPDSILVTKSDKASLISLNLN